MFIPESRVIDKRIRSSSLKAVWVKHFMAIRFVFKYSYIHKQISLIFVTSTFFMRSKIIFSHLAIFSYSNGKICGDKKCQIKHFHQTYRFISIFLFGKMKWTLWEWFKFCLRVPSTPNADSFSSRRCHRRRSLRARFNSFAVHLSQHCTIIVSANFFMILNPTIFNIIRWVAGLIVSSTKRLMVQVLFW